MLAVIDYGVGNLGSIANMLKKLGVAHEVTSDPEKVAGASKIILPGVGSFDHGMRRLQELGLVEALNRAKSAGIPILGICLGMQLMARGSEEGQLPGLGWFKADVVRFGRGRPDFDLRVPHMGWNDVI